MYLVRTFNDELFTHHVSFPFENPAMLKANAQLH